MPRILWSYIDCVSTSQLWTSHILYERSVSPRQNAIWRGTVRWDRLFWAAFKQGHRKLMNVRNGAIPHTLYNFWLLTSASPIYSWTYNIPLESIVYPRDNECYTVEPSNGVVHVQWRSTNVIINVYIYSTLCYFIITNDCYVFVSVLKATSYATENLVYPRQMGYSVGLPYTDTFMGIELNMLTTNVATICFTPCAKRATFIWFTTYWYITKVSRFGEATGNSILILFLFTVVVDVIVITITITIIIR